MCSVGLTLTSGSVPHLHFSATDGTLQISAEATTVLRCGLKFRNRAGFSTRSVRRDVWAAPQHSACVWPPRRCSGWSPAPGRRCGRAAAGWWVEWRSWRWLPWLRIQPTEAFLSASPPPYNRGSCKRHTWWVFTSVQTSNNKLKQIPHITPQLLSTWAFEGMFWVETFSGSHTPLLCSGSLQRASSTCLGGITSPPGRITTPPDPGWEPRTYQPLLRPVWLAFSQSHHSPGGSPPNQIA